MTAVEKCYHVSLMNTRCFAAYVPYLPTCVPTYLFSLRHSGKDLIELVSEAHLEETVSLVNHQALNGAQPKIRDLW